MMKKQLSFSTTICSPQGFTLLNSSQAWHYFQVFPQLQNFSNPKPPHDESLSTNSQNSPILIQNLPGKVYENCQRTARVIILSQLQKMISKEKKLKLLLTKILSEFMPNKNQSESGSQYSNKKGYYESLHYSRVRIGQRQFLKNILLNSEFKETFQNLFENKSFQTSEKARKNQRSQISFEKRRVIIMNIIQQYENKFCAHFKISPSLQEKKLDRVNQFQLEKKQSRSEQRQSFLKESELETITSIQGQIMTSMVNFPLMPIPLLPIQYERYIRFRVQSQ